MHTNTLAYAIAGTAIGVSVLLTASTLATAARSSDDVRDDRSPRTVSGGSPVQGRDGLGSILPQLSDDGTPDQGSGDTAGGTMLAGSIVEIEADIFTDTTIVKAEVNDEKIFFETATRDRDSLIAEIAQRLDMDAATVDSLLLLEVEDRASRSGDRN